MWHLVPKLVPLNDRISHINEWELSINDAFSRCLEGYLISIWCVRKTVQRISWLVIFLGRFFSFRFSCWYDHDTDAPSHLFESREKEKRCARELGNLFSSANGIIYGSIESYPDCWLFSLKINYDYYIHDWNRFYSHWLLENCITGI